MPQDELAFTLHLHPKWTYEATSESHPTLQQEVAAHLSAALNVARFWELTDLDIEGYAVLLESGERALYLSSQHDTIDFSGTGELILPTA